MESKNALYLGALFVGIQMLAIIRNISTNYDYFFWFCDFVPIVYALLFFFKQEDKIKAVVNIGLIPQIVFLLAILYKNISDKSILGYAPNDFELSFFYISCTVIIHFSSIIALLSTRKGKPKYSTLFYSVVFLMIIYIIALFFTSPNGYVNYVYSSGNLLGGYEIPLYTYLWIPLTLLCVVLPTQLFQFLIWRLYEKKNNNQSKNKDKK